MQAFLMNNTPPEKIKESQKIEPDALKELLICRRSIKKFKSDKVSRDILQEIASVAAYAPNQNKNIEIIIIDSDELINAIDSSAIKFIKLIYNLLFSVKLLTCIFQLFSDSLKTIKKKMEYDLFINKHIVKENTSGLFLLFGNPKEPVTENSAQYLLATMIIYAEALGIGTCLMDSLKLSINTSKPIKKLLGISQKSKILGVLSVGYSNENIINKPQGYEINIHWNCNT